MNFYREPFESIQLRGTQDRLPDESPQATIRITDAGGRLIETLTVTGKQGQQMWDTRGLEPGTYYYTLNKAGEYKSGRIVIHR